MTLKMSEQVIEAAQVCLAGVCDLIAAEAEYLPCLSALKRNAEKVRLETKESDLTMIWLCEELEYAAEKGKLNDACNRYTCMALTVRAETEIPRSFISRRSTFKDKLLLRLGNAMDCAQPLEKSLSEHQSLLIPSKSANVAISKIG